MSCLPRLDGLALTGVENESNCVTFPAMQPANVLLHIDELRRHANEAACGTFGTEPAAHVLEFISSAYQDPADVVRALRHLEFITRRCGLIPLFVSRTPWEGARVTFANPRHEALYWATRYETAELGVTSETHDAAFARLATGQALHVNVSFVGNQIVREGRVTDAAAFLVSFFGAVGPHLAAALCLKYGVYREPGSLKTFSLWANGARFPQYRWIPTGAAYEDRFNGLPRLMRPVDGAQKSGGSWVVDRQSRAVWGSPDDDGSTLWDLLRIRHDGRCEIRILPAWPINRSLERVIEDLCFIALLALEYARVFGSATEFFISPVWRHLRGVIAEQVFDGQEWAPPHIGSEEWNAAFAA